MDARDVRQLVVDQIAGRWEQTNSHHVDLRSALVPPTRTKMILQLSRKGKVTDLTVAVWIVLREHSTGDGYVIFYDDQRDRFGLASAESPHHRHPVIVGYYSDFWTTFQGM